MKKKLNLRRIILITAIAPVISMSGEVINIKEKDIVDNENKITKSLNIKEGVAISTTKKIVNGEVVYEVIEKTYTKKRKGQNKKRFKINKAAKVKLRVIRELNNIERCVLDAKEVNDLKKCSMKINNLSKFTHKIGKRDRLNKSRF